MKHTVEDGRGDTAAQISLADRRTKAALPNRRFPIQRFRIILERLQEGETTARKLAAEVEVSPKTISRDVEFLRDRLLFPIEGDWRGIQLTEPLKGCIFCAMVHPPKVNDDPKDHDKTATLMRKIFSSL